jgi:hypothetical protein
MCSAACVNWRTAVAEAYIHINYARYSRTACLVVDCPTCERMRRMLANFQDWYGWTLTCAGCGEMWTDGEMHPRPFARGWRQYQREHAREGLAAIGVPA